MSLHQPVHWRIYASPGCCGLSVGILGGGGGGGAVAAAAANDDDAKVCIDIFTHATTRPLI